LSSQHIEKEFMMKLPDEIDFKDFQSYIREVIKKMLESHKRNAKLINAVIVAALSEDNILEDIKNGQNRRLYNYFRIFQQIYWS
jgi:hypothetical protein